MVKNQETTINQTKKTRNRKMHQNRTDSLNRINLPRTINLFQKKFSLKTFRNRTKLKNQNSLCRINQSRKNQPVLICLRNQLSWASMNVKTMMHLNQKRKSLIEEEKRNQTTIQIRNRHSKLIPFSIIIVSMNSSRNIKNLYLKIPTVKIFIGISSWLY